MPVAKISFTRQGVSTISIRRRRRKMLWIGRPVEGTPMRMTRIWPMKAQFH
jgi:hypothetical protein